MKQKEKQIRYAADELISKGNLDVIGAVFTSGYIAHAEDKTHKGHGFIRRYARQLRSAIPDLNVKHLEFFAEDEDMITWQRTLLGTHQGNMMGIPPSNQVVLWNEMVVSRFEGDKIAEEWVVSELAAQLMFKLH